ncbi:MAG: LapA family protein [Anaerolineaceae bacterium]
MQVFLVFALLISLFAVVFAVQNTAIVTVSFLMWDFNNSLAVVILLTVFTGVLISILMSLPGWIKNRVYQMNLRKKNKDLETKLSKQDETLQATIQELELVKAQAAQAAVTAANAAASAVAAQSTPAPVATVPPSPVPVSTPTYNPLPTQPVDDMPEPGLDDLFTEEPVVSSEEPVKKPKFPGIDRILNR